MRADWDLKITKLSDEQTISQIVKETDVIPRLYNETDYSDLSFKGYLSNVAKHGN